MSHRELSVDGLVVAFGERQVLKGAGLRIPRAKRLALLGADSGNVRDVTALVGAVRAAFGPAEGAA